MANLSAWQAEDEPGAVAGFGFHPHIAAMFDYGLPRQCQA